MAQVSMKGQCAATVSKHNVVHWGQIEIDTANPPISRSRPLKGVYWALVGQVKFTQPFLLSHFYRRGHQSLRQMVQGCVYMFRGQARLTQQGSSSHQQLTSTSSSGHVQRQSFPCIHGLGAGTRHNCGAHFRAREQSMTMTVCPC